MDQTEILANIKKLIINQIPDAKVYLFGSRATGKVHEESDWDILIVSSAAHNNYLQNTIHKELFTLSIEIHSFIHFHLVNQTDWNMSPRYYVLGNSIKDEVVPI